MFMLWSLMEEVEEEDEEESMVLLWSPMGYRKYEMMVKHCDNPRYFCHVGMQNAMRSWMLLSLLYIKSSLVTSVWHMLEDLVGPSSKIFVMSLEYL